MYFHIEKLNARNETVYWDGDEWTSNADDALIYSDYVEAAEEASLVDGEVVEFDK